MYCFFFKCTATTEIYTSLHTLSLHVALPICPRDRESAGAPAGTSSAPAPRRRWNSAALPAPAPRAAAQRDGEGGGRRGIDQAHRRKDRKSTRLNSSH